MRDLIERQDAIDLVFGLHTEHRVYWKDAVVDALKALPSAQPESLTIGFARELDRETIEKLKESMAKAPVMIMAVNDESAQPEIIRCKDCANWDTSWETDAGNHFCSMVDSCTTAEFYCAYAEGETDE